MHRTKQRVKSPVPPHPTLSYMLFDPGNWEANKNVWGNGETRQGFIPLPLSDLHFPLVPIFSSWNRSMILTSQNLMRETKRERPEMGCRKH